MLAICLILFISCKKNEKEIKIDDFSDNFSDTLYLNDNSYTAAKSMISGMANDTIIIKFNNIERRFIGQFKYKFDMDYYGGNNVIFQFEPYKATNGVLIAKYGIY